MNDVVALAPEGGPLDPDGAATGLPKAQPGAPHVTGRKASATGLAKRLQSSRERAKKVRTSRPRRIAIQVSIDVEIHDAVIELAEKHACSMQDVYRRCLRDGLMRYIDLKPISVFEGSGFGVFDRGTRPGKPAAPSAETVPVLDDQRRAARERAAQELCLPGRRPFGDA